METVTLPLLGRALADILSVRAWMGENTRSYASIWVGITGEFGHDLFQFNGVFRLVGDDEAETVLLGLTARAHRDPKFQLKARFEDRDEAMLFKLTFGGS